MLLRSLSIVSLLFLAASCSSTPSQDELDEQAAEATDQCLSDPEASKQWGECNVKASLFSQKEGIAKCQSQHSKASPSAQTMILKIQLKADGRVRNVRAEEGGPKNRPLEKCLRQVVRKIRFAAPPAGVKPVIYFPTQM